MAATLTRSSLELVLQLSDLLVSRRAQAVCPGLQVGLQSGRARLPVLRPLGRGLCSRRAVVSWLPAACRAPGQPARSLRCCTGQVTWASCVAAASCPCMASAAASNARCCVLLAARRACSSASPACAPHSARRRWQHAAGACRQGPANFAVVGSLEAGDDTHTGCRSGTMSHLQCCLLLMAACTSMLQGRQLRARCCQFALRLPCLMGGLLHSTLALLPAQPCLHCPAEQPPSAPAW